MMRNDPCWCGSQKKWKKCHYPKQPLNEQYFKKYGIILKSEEQITGIRHACRLAATVLDKLCSITKVGVTTNELDRYAKELFEEKNAISCCLGYGDPPFPKHICTSLNDVICHGIPNDTPLQQGDIVNIDVACILNGYYGDCSKMVALEPIDAEKRKVVDVSLECLNRAAQVLKPNSKICEIGKAIESYASSQNCSVVNQFVGHGVGTGFHEEPQVAHHYNHSQIPLAAGMTLTIEPMINAGKRSGYIDAKDHWTCRTVDGKPSAQWEHTFLITETGYEILTIPDHTLFSYALSK
ncbi:MAG TPA: methionyl aminopeptidase [Candidatus Rhabdochlamydia sp.]|jgi:methionyl aminopeptidase|nr:methionyl aminopeptidase [Candidatus Rhabdochlamydia sp.]